MVLQYLFKQFYLVNKNSLNKNDKNTKKAELEEQQAMLTLDIVKYVTNTASRGARLQIKYSELLNRHCDNRDASMYGLVVLDGGLVYRGRFGAGVVVPPFESGVFLHPVFLVPFIPGSSIKGVLRAAFQEYLSEQGFEGRGLERCVWAVFGSSEDPFTSIGGVVVFDAYPVKWGAEGLLVGDVVTPHYRGEKKTELDAMPIPARVLSVGEGTVFRIVVGVDEDYVSERVSVVGEDCASAVDQPLRLLAHLLVRGLEKMGVGGKTTRGYGRLELRALRLIPASSSRAKYRRIRP